MRDRAVVISSRLLFLLAFTVFHLIARSQTGNPCGVVAKIYPAATDSIVSYGALISLTSVSTNAGSVDWLMDGFRLATTQNFTYPATAGVHKISLVAHNGNCTDTTTVYYFSVGRPHPIDSTLFANYGLYDTFEYGNCMDATADGGFVLGGYGTMANGRGCAHQGLVVKLRDKGCVDWSRAILDTVSYCGYGDVKKIYASPFDSSYYLVGTNFLMKLDKAGNQVWNRVYRFGPLSNGYYSYYVNPAEITGDDQGHLYLIHRALNWGWMITSLDAAGSVRWSKYFQLGPNPDPSHVNYIASPFGIVCLNGKVYVTGGATDHSTYFDFLTRLDAATGTVDWQRGYQNLLHPGSTSFDQISPYGSLLMVAGTDGGGQGVFLLDTAGNLRKTIKASFYSSYAPHVTKAKADQQGNIYIMQWTEATLTLQPYFYYYTNFVKVDTSFHKYWGLIYPKMNAGDMAVSTHDFGALGSDVGLEASAFLPSFDMRFLKVQTGIDSLANNQNNYCNFSTSDFTLTTMPMTTVAFNWSTDSALSVVAQPVTFYTAVDAYIQSRYTCPDFVDSCQFLKLSGPVSGCNYGDTYTYQLHRNRKCGLVPHWKFPQGVTVRSQTDSTITVQFPGFGVFGVACEIKSCVPVFDSLTVVIKSKNFRVDLGKDTVLCDQTSLKLHAGISFLSYQWQDGSHDSTLTVMQPGLYWVQVTDSCGNALRDSILITPYGANQIDLGPDRTKCNNDTLRLNAPAGFMAYTWSNNYNISSITSQNVVVNPSVDTAYYIKAEKTPGCFAYDTVRITVHQSPPIDLGNDKSFCLGDSAVFDAGAGFQTYAWSGGQSNQRIAVKTAGTYSVVGTTAQGCKSADTVKVLTVYSLPSVSLDKKASLCFGDSKTLNAGNFASYSWSTGQNTATIVVNAIGQYAVAVADANGCKGSDTTAITTINALPTGFLPLDTAVCSYGSVQLKPLASFSRYLWSTGDLNASITVSKLGPYWLEVVDGNTCKGRDTITVNPKDCMKGFYAPAAFTPNDDGKNDAFYPLLFGKVKAYHFTVYNRWGQAIFQTNEQQKGWDGKVAGTLQRSDVFVWICTYQFEGEAAKTEKGTVTLIR